ncbi:MAG: winged helix-turn-helix transcriptional regulator [Alphaproteobacteria bacterium]|nr:winged helix-turn-helix transcriptional regulator [Alphaproteobacteria bacterium]
MIGVYTKNNFLTQSIVELFKHLGATPWQSGQSYQALIIALPQKEINTFFKQNPTMWAICLGCHHPQAYQSLSLPIHLEIVQNALLQLLNAIAAYARFENNTFIFDARTRQLFNKKSKKTIELTEKESDLLSFLAQAKRHKVSREEIMSQVWKYNENTETHTLDSHIYSLRQKLQNDTDALLTYQNGFLQLVTFP